MLKLDLAQEKIPQVESSQQYENAKSVYKIRTATKSLAYTAGKTSPLSSENFMEDIRTYL